MNCWPPDFAPNDPGKAVQPARRGHRRDLAEAARHYDERQLGALVLMVAIANFFNRLNTTFRVPAGTRWD
jgi:alkylhydroperoxidase family enzyme